MKILFSYILILANIALAAQNSSLKLSSSDSIPFFLMLGGQKINPSSSTVVQADSLNSGKIPLDIMLNDSVTHLSFSVQLKPNHLHTYELMKIGSEFQLLPLSVSQKAETVANTGAVNSKDQKESTSNISEPIANDSIPMPGYSGPVGCKELCSEADVALLLKSMSDLFFEKEKFQKAKNFILANCLTTSQLADILNVFDLEDRKLDLAILSLDHVYDIGHFLQLADEFRMATSRSELEKAFNNRLVREN